MSKNKYYYYDQQTCSFVEVAAGRKRSSRRGAAIVGLALVLASVIAWGMDARWIGTPEEAALRAENEALQEQIAEVGDRMSSFSKRLKRLSRTDQRLYRTLLRAEPISEDVRQVGVGGVDVYREAERFSEPTATLIRETSQELDELERRMNLQRTSFRHLTDLAAQYREKLSQLPILLPTNGPIISGYGLRYHPILHVRKMHEGVDMLVRTGTPVVAPGDGVVERIAYGPGYGRFIEIAHPETGYTTRFAHLSEVMPNLEEGDTVERGQKIALSGSTGRSTGPHLHYEILDEDGRPVNPIYFFAPSMTPEKYKALLKKAENSGAALDY